MMEEIVLQAKKREEIGKKVKALRREGGLPAIIYGGNINPIPITLDAHDAGLVLSGVTSSHMITVNVDGESLNVLVRERQREPILGNLLHVDFLAVSLTETLRTNVMVELVGDAPAVKEYGFILVSGLDALEVESLPQNLPERIVVDVSILKDIGDAIYVRDISLSSEVEVLTDPDEMVALVTAPSAEEEEEEEVEEEEVEYGEEGPEVIERGKAEEEEEEF
jgi:large subunit ribosomal protein L25